MQSGRRLAIAAVVAGLLGWLAWSATSVDDAPAEAATPSAGGGPSGPSGRSGPGRVGQGGVEARPVTVAGIGHVRGTIVDEDEQPVAGGTVVLTCLTPAGEVASIAGGTIRMSEDGVFEGPACDGTVCAELRHATHVAAQPWTLERGDDVRLAAQLLPRLWGEVRDADDEPVVDATVVLSAAPDAAPDAVLPVVSPRTSTDADGTFSLAMVAARPCDPCRAALGCDDERLPAVYDSVLVSARAEGYGPARTEIDLADGVGTPDDPIVVTLPAEAAPIAGTLVDPDGQPYPRAFVLARSEDRPSEQHRGEATDGRFTVDGLGDGTYRLRAIQDGVEIATADAEAGDAITMTPAGKATPRDVVVEVTDAGRPLPGVVVRGGPFARQTTDADGQVRARRVIPGTYILRIDARRAPREGPEGLGSGTITIEVSEDGPNVQPHPQSGDAQRIEVDATTLQRR